MKLTSSNGINNAISNVVDRQRRFIKSTVKYLVDKVCTPLPYNTDDVVCFSLDFSYFDNNTAAKRDIITTTLRYYYSDLDGYKVVDDIIDEVKQMAKSLRNDYTPVLEKIDVYIEEGSKTYDYGLSRYIDSGIFIELRSIIDSISSKDLSDAPIMMEL